MVCILIIDDHELFRAGMVLLLRQFHPDLNVVQASSVGAALVNFSPLQTVDVVLMDWFLPHEDPRLNIQRIKTQWPLARLVVVSGNDSLAHQAQLAQLRALGVSGYISKAATPRALIAALDAVIQGHECALPPHEAAAPSQAWREDLGNGSFSAHCRVAEQLTARQKQVVNSLLRGGTNKHIARELGIAEDTVKQHLQVIYEVLGVRGRPELLSLLTQSKA